MVRVSAMHDEHVVQGHLAGREDNVDGLPLVDRGGDLLSARKQVFLGEGVAMRDLGPVGSRNHAHAATLRRARRQRDPGRDVVYQVPVWLTHWAASLE